MLACTALISCKKKDIKTLEGTYSGDMVLSTIRAGVTTTNKFDVNMNVEFKGNKYILIESFYTGKIPYNTSQKTFRKEEGSNETYYGYFAKDSLFLEFKAAKSGTTYYYNLKKSS